MNFASYIGLLSGVIPICLPNIPIATSKGVICALVDGAHSMRFSLTKNHENPCGDCRQQGKHNKLVIPS
jgi:hypothetical protein